MNKLLFLLAACVASCFSASAYAQTTYGLYQTCQLQTAQGQAVAGASVYFLTQPANTAALTPQAQVYSSSTGGAVSQPILTNGQGICTAYLSPGVYTVCYVSQYTGTQCNSDQNVLIGGVYSLPSNTGIPFVNNGTWGTTLPPPTPGLTTEPINNTLGLPASSTPNGGLQQTGWTKGLCFGDSRMAGSDASSSAYYFCNLIAAWAGYGSGNATNYGVSGTKMADIAASVFNHYTPANTSTTMVNFEGGVNDSGSMGPDEGTVISNAEAAVGLMSIPRSQIVEGGDISLPTNWTTDTTYPAMTGIQTTTQGAVAVFPYTLTAATQQILLWYTCIVGDAGKFSVVDSQNGAPIGMTTGVYPQSLASSTGLTQAPCSLPLSYPRSNPPGSGTITVTMTSATGSVHILGIGYGSPQPSGVMAPGTPGVVWSDIYRLGHDRNGQNVEGYNEDIQQACNTLYGMGFYVDCVTVNNFTFWTTGTTNPEYALGNGTQPSTCTASASTGTDLHMCNLGQYEWLQAVISSSSVPLSRPTQTPGFNPAFYPKVTTFTNVLQFQGYATSTLNQCSGYLQFWNSIWNGSAAVANIPVQEYVCPAAGTNPTLYYIDYSTIPGSTTWDNPPNLQVQGNLRFQGGSSMNADQGNGLLLQHSTGSTTPNDLTCYDSHGNTIDCGTSLSNFLAGAPLTNPTISLDGSASNNNGVTSSATLTVGPFPATADDGIVCEIEYNAATTISSVLDNVNSSHYTTGPGATNGWGEAIYYLPYSAGGSVTVTMTTAAAEAYTSAACQSWKPSSPGLLTLDGTMVQSANGSSANPNTGTAITPAQTSELVIGDVASNSLSSISAGSGFALIGGARYGTFGAAEYQIQTTPTATDAPFTNPSSSWAESQAGFYFLSVALPPQVQQATLANLTVTGTCTGCTSGAVSQITAGTGITISPSGGTGNVTINNAGTATSGRLTAPIENTGSTSSVELESMAIPANTVGINSTLRILLGFSACTAASTPFSACTAANTGTCTWTVYFSTAATGGTTINTANAIAAAKSGIALDYIQQQASLSSELIQAQEAYGSSASALTPVMTAFNMANASYINVYVTNSVSADQCYLTNLNIQVQP